MIGRMNLQQLAAQALSLHQQGRESEAEALYLQILAATPRDLTASCMLGAIRFRQHRPEEAMALFDAALEAHPPAAGPLIFYAQLLQGAGRSGRALDCLQCVLALDSNHVEALINRGNLFCSLGRFAEALADYEQALSIQPGSDLALHNRGAALRSMGRNAEALTSFDAALAVNPNNFDAWLNRGNALRDTGRLDLALQSFDRAVAIAPDNPAALNNRGNALKDLKRPAEALASFDRALALHPDDRLLRSNRALVLLEMKRFAEALTEFGPLLRQKPDDARMACNRGIALEGLHRFDEALKAYDATIAAAPGFADAHLVRSDLLTKMARYAEAVEGYDRVLALAPRSVSALTNRGTVLQQLHRFDEALESYDRAISLAPDSADALYNRGNLLWLRFQRLSAALEDLTEAYRLDPERPYLEGDLAHVRIEMCDWDGIDEKVTALAKGVRQGRKVVRPVIFQAVSSSPEDLQRAATIYCRDRFPPQVPLVSGSAGRAGHPGKIRIGYVGGEFREHAMALLMAGLYEHHDRSKFEIVAFDVGGSDGSALRRRLEAAFDRWVDLAAMTDRQRAERIRNEKIDILVNIIGYFQSEPMGVFAHRPAPVQVSYLGYPATLGAPYIDYLLADRIVVPEGEQGFYTEKIVYLPETYWATDSRLPVSEKTPGRSDCGLPDDGFVFCNFNHVYKLTPKTFDLWMDILKEGKDSVLWLLQSNSESPSRLRAEAEKRGVAGERLVFAPPLPPAEHLARLRLADLSLDSLPYNAHTTASDCLWVGVPILTLPGSTFPGRVAASLLEAIGLPELIAGNAADYRKCALRLAGEPAYLQSIRAKLSRNRSTMPLFDTARFCRHIEAAYQQMWERDRRGEDPQGFTVTSVA